MQMIEGTLSDVLKNWPAFNLPMPPRPKLCGRAKKFRPHKFFFKTILMWACFWHSLKDFKVGVTHPRGEIGS